MKTAPRLEDLIGLPLWAVGRAADMLWLQFGQRRTLSSSLVSRDVTRDVGELALHVSCPWRVHDQNGIVVGSQDLAFPFGCSKSVQVPDDFDWDKSPSRLDQLLDYLNASILPLKVISASAGLADALLLTLESGFVLDALPVCRSEGEHWRLFEPGAEQRDHLVAESQPGVSVVVDLPGPMYTAARASIRLMADALDPLDVTFALRLPYDHARRRGEPRIRRRLRSGAVHEYSPYRQGMWSMSSERWVRSTDLDHHIRWLLDQLEPRSEELRRLIDSGVKVDIFCFSVGLPANPPKLPDETMRRADVLSIPINIDYYCTDGD